MAIPTETQKWSRNISEEVINETNRSRLIERQRQLLETKRTRQQQVTVTSTRPKSARSLRPTSGLSRSNEKLIDSKEGTYLYDREGIVNPVSIQSPSDDDSRSDNYHDRRGSLPSPPQLSPITHNPSAHGKRLSQQLSTSPSTSTSASSNRAAAASKQRQSSSTGRKSLSSSYEDLKDEVETIKDLDISDDLRSGHCELNPLKAILNSNELLLFATEPVSPCKTYQCIIVRDKRGIDRSFYPTYYIYLQDIIEKQNGAESDQSEVNLTSSISNNNNNIDNSSSSTSSILNDDSPPDRLSKTHSNSQSMRSNANHRQVFLLGGRRRKKSKTYLISNDPFDITRDTCIAKLKSNVLGTLFNAIRISQNGQRYEIATVIYETNVLGFKGPRKMTIILPKNDEVCPCPGSTLVDLWKTEPSNKSLVTLKNKTPVWNEDTQSYVLNFHGRVTQPSVKNFQLIVSKKQDDSADIGDMIYVNKSDKMSPGSTTATGGPSTPPTFFPTNPAPNTGSFGQIDDDITMQFGRKSDKEFTCDVTWPLSILQAFCIALSSFDSKLACE